MGRVRIVADWAGIGTPARVLTREGKAAVLAGYRTVVEVDRIGSLDVQRPGAERMLAGEPVGEERGVIVSTASAAAHAVRVRDSRSCTGTFFIHEDVLAQDGVTDPDRYRAVPGGPPMEADLFPDPVEEFR